MTHSVNFLYSLSGVAVGMVVGMTGMGGGSLMTPLLILVFGVPPATAVGTDLLYAAATKSGGTLVHGLTRTIAWPVVGRLAAGSVPMAALTLFGLSRLDITGSVVGGMMTAALTGALFLTAAMLIFRKHIVALYGARLGGLTPRQSTALTVTTGALLGLLVSISSVGAGALGVTALLLLYPRLPTARIVGSDIAHGVPLTLVAGIGHWLLGSVDWSLLGALLAGSLPGIVLGSYLATRMPEAVLRFALAGALMLVGGKLAL